METMGLDGAYDAGGAREAGHRDEIACRVAVAGHCQDPNAAEPARVHGLRPKPVSLPRARRVFDFSAYLEESTFTGPKRAARRTAMRRIADFPRRCFPT